MKKVFEVVPFQRFVGRIMKSPTIIAYFPYIQVTRQHFNVLNKAWDTRSKKDQLFDQGRFLLRIMRLETTVLILLKDRVIMNVVQDQDARGKSLRKFLDKTSKEDILEKRLIDRKVD